MSELVIEHRPAGKNGTLAIAVKLDGETVHADKLDIHRASSRERLAKAIAEACPDLAVADVQAELLRIAADVGKPDRVTGDEVDVSRIVRPELFHRADVSGISIPVVGMTETGPVGRWAVYLRWADGKRERRDLLQSIDLPDGGRLWLNPQPAPPGLTQAAGWSAESRRAWLKGEPCPGPAEVFKSLCAVTAYYLDFTPDTAAGTAALLALWSILSYCYPPWPAVPYLSIGGPLGSGKSRVFEVLARLVFRPMPSANVTAPTLFRTLHETGGVLLLDEAERLRDGTPDAGEIRSILLSGYKAGCPARRLEPCGDGRFKTQVFDVFGPKAIAGIASLPPPLASRCIRLVMFRAAPDSPKPRRSIDEDPDRWQRLRDDLHMMALEHGPTWLELANRRDVCPSMSGRDFELSQPILAIAGWLEERGAVGLLSMMQAYAQQTIDLNREDQVPDVDELLLRLLADSVMGGFNDGLTPAELLRRANEREPSVFGKWSTRGIATTLRRYGIQARQSHGTRTYRDVSPFHLVEIERRYGLDLGLPEGTRQMGKER